MELWIRNQKKDRLIKCQSLDILDRNQSPKVKEYIGEIELDAMIIGNDFVNLGTYTKERALEVLDEIQELIKPTIIATQYQCAIKDNKKTEFDLIMNPVKTEIQEFSTIVYEMPKE